MKGKLNLIGVGGAGINSTVETYEYIKELGNMFSDVSINLLDTSIKTIKNYRKYSEDFKLITTNKVSVEDYDGMGSERKNKDVNSDFKSSVEEYVDLMKFNKSRSDFYVITISTTGATGSTIGLMLADIMLNLGYNLIVVMIGSTSSLIRINNDIDTTVKLNSIAVRNNKALSVIYFNNTIDGNVNSKNEKIVNSRIRRILSVFSLYISGSVHNLDLQDIINFITPTNYSTFNINPGIYELVVGQGNISDDNILLALSIIKDESSSFDINTSLLVDKTGYLQEIEEIFDTDCIHLLFRRNQIQKNLIHAKDALKSMSADLFNGDKYITAGNTDIFDELSTDEDDGF